MQFDIQSTQSTTSIQRRRKYIGLTITGEREDRQNRIFWTVAVVQETQGLSQIGWILKGYRGYILAVKSINRHVQSANTISKRYQEQNSPQKALNRGKLKTIFSLKNVSFFDAMQKEALLHSQFQAIKRRVLSYLFPFFISCPDKTRFFNLQIERFLQLNNFSNSQTKASPPKQGGRLRAADRGKFWLQLTNIQKRMGGVSPKGQRQDLATFLQKKAQSDFVQSSRRQPRVSRGFLILACWRRQRDRSINLASRRQQTADNSQGRGQSARKGRKQAMRWFLGGSSDAEEDGNFGDRVGYWQLPVACLFGISEPRSNKNAGLYNNAFQSMRSPPKTGQFPKNPQPSQKPFPSPQFPSQPPSHTFPSSPLPALRTDPYVELVDNLGEANTRGDEQIRVDHLRQAAQVPYLASTRWQLMMQLQQKFRFWKWQVLHGKTQSFLGLYDSESVHSPPSRLQYRAHLVQVPSEVNSAQLVGTSTQVPWQKKERESHLMLGTQFLVSSMMQPLEQLKQEPLLGQYQSQATLTTVQLPVTGLSQNPCSQRRTEVAGEQSPKMVTRKLELQYWHNPLGWQRMHPGIFLLQQPLLKIWFWLHPLMSQTAGTVVPLVRVSTGGPGLVGVEGREPPAVIQDTVPLMHWPLRRMQGQIHWLQVAPSSEQRLQPTLACTQGLHWLLERKQPSWQERQATLERQLVQAKQICEHERQFTPAG